MRKYLVRSYEEFQDFLNKYCYEDTVKSCYLNDKEKPYNYPCLILHSQKGKKDIIEKVYRHDFVDSANRSLHKKYNKIDNGIGNNSL